ncbi:hypothetical protein BJY01DRAFT_218864 [Aspergillus pseudoustus]|uniref:Uncharacterized protein n=1 Tax=Aspergillus pseudoustus TaxID=1810923 RepID=A0ABR4JJM7_9EURO
MLTCCLCASKDLELLVTIMESWTTSGISNGPSLSRSPVSTCRLCKWKLGSLKTPESIGSASIQSSNPSRHIANRSVISIVFGQIRRDPFYAAFSAA